MSPLCSLGPALSYALHSLYTGFPMKFLSPEALMNRCEGKRTGQREKPLTGFDSYKFLFSFILFLATKFIAED